MISRKQDRDTGKLLLKTLTPKKDSFRVIGFRVFTLLCMALPLAGLGFLWWYFPATLTRPTTPEDFWTFVQAVSGVAVLSISIGVGLVAWYGLRSIRLAREDMVIRATREARLLALKRAEEFSRVVIANNTKLFTELNQAGVEPFARNISSAAGIFDNEKLYPVAKKWLLTVPADTQSHMISYMNDLEAWAMYFTARLADTSILFKPIAPTYCGIVLSYSPWVIVCRKEQNANYYPSVIGLFNAWQAEMEAEQGGSLTDAAIRAAEATAERLAKHRVPAPLGTRVDN